MRHLVSLSCATLSVTLGGGGGEGATAIGRRGSIGFRL
jgi:hypothetical protein